MSEFSQPADARLQPTFRPVGEKDRQFVERIYFATQRGIIEQLFSWRGDTVEKAKFEESYDPANTRIISAKGEDIGWVTVQRFPSRITLHSIYLIEDWQCRGIGGGIIGDLIAEAVEPRPTSVRAPGLPPGPRRRVQGVFSI